MRSANYKTSPEWRAEGRMLKHGVSFRDATEYLMVPGTPTGLPLYRLDQTVAISELAEVVPAAVAFERRHPAGGVDDIFDDRPAI